MKLHLMKRILCLFLIAGLFTACASPNYPSNTASKNAPDPQLDTSSSEINTIQPEEAQWENQLEGAFTSSEEALPENAPVTENTDVPTGIDSLLQQMTLRQKVGQLFIVRPDALDLEQTQAQIDDTNTAGMTEVTDAMLDTLKDYPVGGIVMFSKNILSPEQITAFNESLQVASDIPLFLSVDEEGGAVARLANHAAFDLPEYESAAAVGSTNDPSEAQAMGSTIGMYLQEYGFNMDFAPDADVNTNPDNPVIGTRAFSSDAKIAAQMAGAMAEGLRQQGIIPVFKHFPGHGDTAEDSHTGIATTYKTEAEMKTCEWLPFEAAGSTDCIMVGHIATPSISNDLTPATMSYTIVSDILKGEMGFQGLVITDSLSMGAIIQEYTPGEAALGALQAGCDILLMPNDLQEAFTAVVTAVEDGSLSEQRLDESVRHILAFKQSHGILPD